MTVTDMKPKTKSVRDKVNSQVLMEYLSDIEKIFCTNYSFFQKIANSVDPELSEYLKVKTNKINHLNNVLRANRVHFKGQLLGGRRSKGHTYTEISTPTLSDKNTIIEIVKMYADLMPRISTALAKADKKIKTFEAKMAKQINASDLETLVVTGSVKCEPFINKLNKLTTQSKDIIKFIEKRVEINPERKYAKRSMR